MHDIVRKNKRFISLCTIVYILTSIAAGCTDPTEFADDSYIADMLDDYIPVDMQWLITERAQLDDCRQN